MTGPDVRMTPDDVIAPGDRILRFRLDEDEAARWGIIRATAAPDVVEELDADPIRGQARGTGVTHPLAGLHLLAPIESPSKIIGIGKNYADHAREMGGEAPDTPIIFLKAPSALIGPGEAIELPTWSREVHHEAEVALVIARRAKDVPAEEADSVIFGFTCANDVTARDVQRSDGQWTRAKSFDTSCPMGPWIVVAGADWAADLRVRCRIDGHIRQDESTALMLTGMRGLVAYVSSAFTLEAGDVVITGTPAGIGPIRAGQSVEVEVEGIGRLVNPVSAPAS